MRAPKRDLISQFLGNREELRGMLAPYVTVERCNVCVMQSGESRQQLQQLVGRLPECFSLLDQSTCSLRGRLAFRRRKPFDMHKWVYQCNLKLDFFATKGRRAGQGRDLTKRTCELLDGLKQRRALQ